MIELRCPSCRQSIKLDESFTGRRIACVGCAKEFNVPDLKQLAANKDSTGNPTSRPRSKSPAMSVARPAQPEPTLLDKARQHRDLVLGGIIAVVLGVAGLVVYSSMQNSQDEENDPIVSTTDNDTTPATPDHPIAAINNEKATIQTKATPKPDNIQPPAVKTSTKSQPSTQARATHPSPTPTTKKTPQKASDDSPPSKRPAQPPVSSADYISKADILLRHSTELNDWVAVTPGTQLSAGAELALPAPFEAQLEIGREICTLRIQGGTRVRVIGPSDEFPFGFVLRRGRLIVAGHQGSGVPGFQFTLAVRGETWHVESLSGDTLFGIEILPRRPEQFEHDFGDDDFTGGILVVKGSVRLTDQAGKTRVVAGNSWLSLARSDRVSVKSADAAPNQTQLPPPQFRPLPDWLDLDTAAAKPAKQADAELFTSLFNRQQPYGEAIKPLRTATDAAAIRLAVECESLLGDRIALMQSLADAKQDEVRQAAIAGLREQMPTSKEDRDKFQQELTEVFGQGAKAIYPLLWGYADEDIRNNKFTCFQLVDWLMDDSLAVRELTWSQVTKYATAKYAYKPNGSLRSRRVAAKKWQQHVAKTGTILGKEL